MESIVIIVIIIVVVIGLAGIVLGPISASKNGDKMASAFSQAYREQYGVAPSDAAERAIATGTAVIFNAMGSGQYAVPGENLKKCINDYGSAVGWNESKMELGLMCLLAVCCTKNQNVAPGCQWAADIISNSILLHCPSVRRSVYGF